MKAYLRLYYFPDIAAIFFELRKQIIRHTDPVNINLVAVVPFEKQTSKWKARDREKYFNILSKCDEVIILSTHYQSGCYHKRNRYMVDNSSKLICCYNGSSGGTRYTIEYAESKSIPIINIYDSYNLKEIMHKSLVSSMIQ